MEFKKPYFSLVFVFIFYMFFAFSVNWDLFKGNELSSVRGGLNSTLAMVESLVERNSFIIDESRFVITRDKMKVGEHFYSDKAPGFSLLLTPIYGILYKMGLTFNEELFLTVWVLTLYGVVLPAVLSFWIFLKIASFLFPEAPKSMICEAKQILAYGSLFVSFSGLLNYHVMGAFFLLLSIYLIILEEKALQRKYSVLAGLSMGILFTFDIPTGGLFLLLITCLFGVRLAAKPLIGFWIGAFPPILVYILINFSITGKLLPPFFYREAFFQFPGSIHNTLSLTGEAGTETFFNIKRLYLIFRNFFGSMGLFSLCPILSLAVLGWATKLKQIQLRPHWTLREQMTLVLILGTLIQVLFYNCIVPSSTGCVYGVRHTIPILPFFIMGVIFFKRSGMRKTVFTIAVFFSVLLSLGGAFEHKADCGHSFGWRQLIPAYSFFHSLQLMTN